MTCLVIVTRVPGSASAKTRLAGGVGPGASLRLQEAFLVDTLQWASALGERRVLAVHPPRGAAALAEHAPGFAVVGQPEGSFGERMRGAVNVGFAPGGAGPVAMIATDSPTLPEAIIADAWEAVSTTHGADVALAPACDGGWVGIAARAPLPPGCFDGVRWSAPATLADTRAALQAAGLRVAQVSGWYDVDTRDDLARLARELREPGARALPRTAAVLSDLEMG